MLNRFSELHAEQIITELLESVTREASFPLKSYRLEGDAVVFTATIDDDISPAVNDIYLEIKALYKAFLLKHEHLKIKVLADVSAALV